MAFLAMGTKLTREVNFADKRFRDQEQQQYGQMLHDPDLDEINSMLGALFNFILMLVCGANPSDWVSLEKNCEINSERTTI